MDVKIEPSWKQVLAPEFEKPYFPQLIQFVKQEYSQNTCYPPGSQLFSAFDHAPFHDVKVVILGQDPYHGPQQANGLCFSVADGIALPPSLQNIFKELQTDVGTQPPTSGNLERWARQGVLLLNATLSVRAHQAGSHQGKGWEQFTDAVVSKLSAAREGLVFLLWGGYAKRKGAKIDTSKHLVLTCGHPSPLSANRGYWFGNKHFSKTNKYLEDNQKEPINW
ncbi:uracil-DNA glycosylase [Marinirhabdus gelatinilytica]|uniref:Uracil-DNA glycosylase n=1 Tax=Marinirhabdus gelatinilytica TaxID=1703343 RepID=A0A370QA54_9FLAO|nr:uracil-DNA glycosylase [Marinirhabdus gelatinilytica]RDK85189.1 uracil-DNA glycosylase [Marinirhabdus gelatinilytica]